MNDLVLSKLKDLKLSGVAKTLDVRNEEAIKENLSFMKFFELLLNDESTNRVANARIKRFAKAKFPNHKTIEEYNFKYQPSLNKREIYNLATCEFIKKQRRYSLYRSFGNG